MREFLLLSVLASFLAGLLASSFSLDDAIASAMALNARVQSATRQAHATHQPGGLRTVLPFYLSVFFQRRPEMSQFNPDLRPSLEALVEEFLTSFPGAFDLPAFKSDLRRRIVPNRLKFVKSPMISFEEYCRTVDGFLLSCVVDWLKRKLLLHTLHDISVVHPMVPHAMHDLVSAVEPPSRAHISGVVKLLETVPKGTGSSVVDVGRWTSRAWLLVEEALQSFNVLLIAFQSDASIIDQQLPILRDFLRFVRLRLEPLMGIPEPKILPASPWRRQYPDLPQVALQGACLVRLAELKPRNVSQALQELKRLFGLAKQVDGWEMIYRTFIFRRLLLRIFPVAKTRHQDSYQNDAPHVIALRQLHGSMWFGLGPAIYHSMYMNVREAQDPSYPGVQMLDDDPAALELLDTRLCLLAILATLRPLLPASDQRLVEFLGTMSDHLEGITIQMSSQLTRYSNHSLNNWVRPEWQIGRLRLSVLTDMQSFLNVDADNSRGFSTPLPGAYTVLRDVFPDWRTNVTIRRHLLGYGFLLAMVPPESREAHQFDIALYNMDLRFTSNIEL